MISCKKVDLNVFMKSDLIVVCFVLRHNEIESAEKGENLGYNSLFPCFSFERYKKIYFSDVYMLC